MIYLYSTKKGNNFILPNSLSLLSRIIPDRNVQNCTELLINCHILNTIKEEFENTKGVIVNQRKTNNTMAKGKRTNNTMAKRKRTNNDL